MKKFLTKDNKCSNILLYILLYILYLLFIILIITNLNTLRPITF